MKFKKKKCVSNIQTPFQSPYMKLSNQSPEQISDINRTFFVHFKSFISSEKSVVPHSIFGNYFFHERNISTNIDIYYIPDGNFYKNLISLIIEILNL